jgi:hypothetical protein
MNGPRTLREVFQRLDDLVWSDVVYLAPGLPTLESSVLVLDPNDVEPDDSVPTLAKEAGFVSALAVVDIRDVRDNARELGKVPTMPELLEAFAYYLRNDAFTTFEK